MEVIDIFFELYALIILTSTLVLCELKRTYVRIVIKFNNANSLSNQQIHFDMRIFLENIKLHHILLFPSIFFFIFNLPGVFIPKRYTTTSNMTKISIAANLFPNTLMVSIVIPSI